MCRLELSDRWSETQRKWLISEAGSTGKDVGTKLEMQPRRRYCEKDSRVTGGMSGRASSHQDKKSARGALRLWLGEMDKKPRLRLSRGRRSLDTERNGRKNRSMRGAGNSSPRAVRLE
ncbi:hypothetical protein A7K93_05850 [Candidatus Methylacidiphilum fumarolicum]|nr:hypothetical protein A7K73_09085 [Candidatus Methylacidiphilum fumarolicum]TFE71629.1 hypothetical protein A7K72_10655 [Candidatus Methylacidiphilum fumarolicum]TFE73589.1 hypothetical protein A7K93_05850 [Candidatus Methylacidiphilum fumarolicum]TFE75346.1 hypothetical protein A7D33_01825 [Candidatus Methylacidiphilum fumarolicum]